MVSEKGKIFSVTPTDEEVLAIRQNTGCMYDIGTCLCPDPPFKYEGCKAPKKAGD